MLKRVSRADDPRIEDVRALFREYAEELGVSLCFQGFDQELEELPGVYAPPRGTLILALDEDGNAIACVAVKEKFPRVAEMKRLYVQPDARGRGLGRILTEECITFADEVGYTTLLLDTLERLEPALRLYEELGFRRVPPYTENPEPDAVFMSLALRPELG